jgi:hypothetical protein
MSLFTRRSFLERGLLTGTAVGLADLAFVHQLPPVSAADVRDGARRVALEPDVEPLVRLIEDTPRPQVIGAVADKIRAGVGYQDLLAAVFLAGVRGIQPRPVGFKFHAVLVINSAHLASMACMEKERWLPLLWAIDNFKSSQERNRREGDWSMSALDSSKLPALSQARERFTQAMDQWDEVGADRAVTALARQAGANEILELFFRYGARDFRDIGHKAIFVANATRTLNAIGWRHAEPVLRSLAYALLEHEGDSPANRDDPADRPGRDNLQRLKRIPADWMQGKRDPEVTGSLLRSMRTANAADASSECVELLEKKVHPASLWDALFLRGGELLMQQPGVIGIHCVTSVNALHYAYQQSGVDQTRQLMLLQAAAFLAMFRARMESGLKKDRQLDKLEKVAVKPGNEGIAEILVDVSKDPVLASRKLLSLAEEGGPTAQSYMAAARRLIFSKGNDSHDYKFSSAAMEDYYNVSPEWRNRYLASSLFHQHGTNDKNNQLIEKARAALA